LTGGRNISISAGSISAQSEITTTSKNISLISRGDIQTNRIYGLNITMNSKGNIQTNGIFGLNITIASGGSISTQQISGNDGNISLTASLGIRTAGISSFSEFKQAGNITIKTPDVFEVYTIDEYEFGGSSKGDILTFSTYGSGGSLRINAKKFISSGNIYAYTYLGQGKGGNVTINTTEDIKVEDIITTSEAGNGGNIQATSTSGSINSKNIATYSINADAGKVTLKAGNEITVGEINAFAKEGGGKGGEVKLNANQDISTKLIFSSSATELRSVNMFYTKIFLAALSLSVPSIWQSVTQATLSYLSKKLGKFF